MLLSSVLVAEKWRELLKRHDDSGLMAKGGWRAFVNKT